MKPFKPKTKVQWKWMGRFILGEVLEVFLKPIQKEIKGKKIKRNGSEENPAYLVKSKAGNEALKLHSELEIESKNSSYSGPKPTMFDED